MAGVCCVASTPIMHHHSELRFIESEQLLAFANTMENFDPRKCMKTVIVWTWVVPQRVIFEKFDSQLGIFEKQYKLEGGTL